MTLSGFPQRLAAGMVGLAILLVTAPAGAAAPPLDERGYIDSTARCATPDSAVVFGSTATARVAICKTPQSTYEYRGVRVRDGAKLIVPASAHDDGFVAENDGVTYTLTAKSLVVTADSQEIRSEPMVDVHGTFPAGTAPSAAPKAVPSQAPKSAPSPAPTIAPTTAPPSKPLPAEVGGSAANG